MVHDGESDSICEWTARREAEAVGDDVAQGVQHSRGDLNERERMTMMTERLL